MSSRITVMLLCLLSSSCAPIKHEVSGTVKVQIDVDNLLKFFTIYCEQQHPNDALAKEQCVSKQLVQFIQNIDLSPN